MSLVWYQPWPSAKKSPFSTSSHRRRKGTMRIPLGGMCANRPTPWGGVWGERPPSLALIYLRLHLGTGELADDPIFMLIKSMAPRAQIKTTPQTRCLLFTCAHPKSNALVFYTNQGPQRIHVEARNIIFCVTKNF